MGKKQKITHGDIVREEVVKRIVDNTNVFKPNKILCIILLEGKGSKWVWINDDTERFSIHNNTYFIEDGGTYLKNKIRFMIFLEGVSLPLHHGYLDKEVVTKTFVNKDTGESKNVDITKIKGLNFDSKVIDILLNKHLSDEFTKVHMDLPNMVIVILLAVSVILGLINIGLRFWKG